MADPDFEYIDGFDHYGGYGDSSAANMVAGFQSEGWTTGVSSIVSKPPLGGTGVAAGNSGGGTNSKALPGNYPRHIGGVTISVANFSSADASFIAFRDGTTVQATVGWDASGKIGVYRAGSTLLGAEAGTSLAAANVSHCLEWDIRISNTVGYAKVWLDGVLIINISAVDTCNNSNEYANSFAMTFISSYVVTFDHLYVRGYLAATGTETPCLTNPIIETSFPIADSERAFDVNQSWAMFSYLGTDYYTSAVTAATGTARFSTVTAEVSGNVTRLGFLAQSTSFPGVNWKMALYADNAGVPGALLGQSDVVTGGVSGDYNSAPLSTPVAVTAGTKYWLAIVGDASLPIRTRSGSAGYSLASVYPAFPSTGAGAATGTESAFYALISNTGGPNYKQVTYAKADDKRFNGSSTVGAQDLFTFAPLTFNPTTIHSVNVRGAMTRSDSGTRTFALLSKSAGNVGYGSLGSAGVAPGTAYAYYGSTFWRNPNGDVAWTKASLDAATSGYKVIS